MDAYVTLILSILLLLRKQGYSSQSSVLNRAWSFYYIYQKPVITQWTALQHGNLLKSIRWFLKEDGRAWVIAGFHTGREKMKGFYEDGALSEAGLEIERIWEKNAEGFGREWVTDRGIEDVTERKRWLVIGILKRKG
jgi:hypothetical protein